MKNSGKLDLNNLEKVKSYVKDMMKPEYVNSNDSKRRIPGDMRDFDDAFIECLEDAANNLKEKNPIKDLFKKQ